MSTRELRLRERIDVLTDARDAALAALPPPIPAAKRRRCVYCGVVCRGVLTCDAHEDLPGLDGFYATERRAA